MNALLVVCALGSIALGCYLVYLVSGELRPSGTVIGMRQRYARANRDTAVLFWFLAVMMFLSSPMFLWLISVL